MKLTAEKHSISLRPERLRFKTTIKIALIFVILSACCDRIVREINHSKTTGVFVSDFVAYWSAFRLAEQGLNPYSLQEFQDFKMKMGYVRPEEWDYVFWYFPWFLTLFSPLLIWPFGVSAILWLGFNLCFPMVVGFFAWKVIYPDRPQAMAAFFLGGMILVPYLVLISMGQIIFLGTLGVIGSVLCLEKKREGWAGFFLILTTIKPQTVFLFYILLGMWMVQNKRFRVLASSLWIFLALQAATLIRWPSIYSSWILTSQNPLDYMSATLTSFLMYLMKVRLGETGEWMLWVIPAFAACACVGYFLRKKVVWKDHLPSVLCLSLVAMPYGGLSDFNLLAITQTALAGRLTHPLISRRRKYLGIGLLLMFHLVTFSVFMQCGRNHHYLWWIPTVYLGGYLILSKYNPQAIMNHTGG